MVLQIGFVFASIRGILPSPPSASFPSYNQSILRSLLPPRPPPPRYFSDLARCISQNLHFFDLKRILFPSSIDPYCGSSNPSLHHLDIVLLEILRFVWFLLFSITYNISYILSSELETKKKAQTCIYDRV